MLISTAAFCDYFEGIRRRTLNFLDRIPPERADFAPYPGKFTLGDLVRHLGSAESMFVQAALDGRWTYGGHGRELGATLEDAVAYLHRQHAAAMARLRAAPPEALAIRRPTLKGHPVAAWHLLMAMVEHEVHHRAQVSQYLLALGLEPSQVFGLRIEQVEPE